MQFKNDNEYFADSEYLSNSQLKDFEFCQYLYEGKHLTGVFKDEIERDYFTYGSAVDCLLTEPDGTFEQRFFPIDRRIDVSEADQLPEAISALKKEIEEKEATGKAHKLLDDKLVKMEAKLETMKNVIGKTQITMAAFDNITESANELLRQPLYKIFGVGANGRSQSILTAEIDGIKMKGKLDYINIEKRVIADVKTTASMDRFNPMIYARQLAYYRLLASEVYKVIAEDWDCYLLVVDKGTNSKRSEIYHISKYLIDQATAELLEKLKKFKETKESGFFTPITEKPDVENARHEKCFNCMFYNQCGFSVQKEITMIS